MSDLFMEAVAAQKSVKTDAAEAKLLEVVEKRIRTGFIGALAQFEERFSKLWGNCETDSQKNAKRIYEECRKSILDLGNDQIRRVRKELFYFRVEFKPRINTLRRV